jgi:isopentenyl-diphosphate delta-isomerase
MSLSNDEDEVILVDASDRAIGTAPKLAAHRKGLLHRAVSVQLRDQSGRLLLQKRHIGKYHSGGLWSNTCCSHPRPGEDTAAAAQRRLQEEMGISCPLTPLFTTCYRAVLDNAMTENEMVHCFGGLYVGEVRPNPTEAEGHSWIHVDNLRQEVNEHPERYSAWFRIYLRDHWAELTGSG